MKQALVLLSIFAAGCGNSINLPIYFSCDAHGRLEPCGCFSGQYGGLTRLKTVLDSEKAELALRVDIGDAIGGKEDYDIIQYGYMLRAFSIMKYDALNVGHREAQLNIEQLRKIRSESPVPILSANLIDAKKREPIFEPYRIVKRKGFRIGIIGVLDPRGLEGIGKGLTVEQIESTLSRYLVKLRSQTDLIVLLAFTDEATLTRLAQQFYEVQIILGGNVSQPAQDLIRENRSLVYFVTNEARALGILKLKLDQDKPLQVLRNEILLLHDKIPQDQSFQQLAKEYRLEIQRAHLRIDNSDYLNGDMIPGVRALATYVGTEECIGCHPSAAKTWEKSGHAHAFETLKKLSADSDPKCIACHTIGFGNFSGYRRKSGSQNLVHVGCESCHGPGSLHLQQKIHGDTSVDFNFRPLDAGDCKQCHYGEFSRPFDWDMFWPLIQHGKEDQLARLNLQ